MPVCARRNPALPRGVNPQVYGYTGLIFQKTGVIFLPLQSMGSRDKSERRDNHFTLEISRRGGNLQRHGGIADGNAMFYPNQLGNFLLKFLYERAIIGKPFSIQHIT